MTTSREKNRGVWASAAGVLAALPSFLASCCGAGCAGPCGTVCVAPVASLLGVSVAGFLASGMWKALQSVLIAVGAVSFTMAYYTLYKNPARGAEASESCCRAPAGKVKMAPAKAAKLFFWVSLLTSVVFAVYPVVSGFSRPKEDRAPMKNMQPECRGTDGKSPADCRFEPGKASSGRF